MRILTVNIPDDVYERVERRAAERGASLDQEVGELLDRGAPANGDALLVSARARMKELFCTVTGFQLGTKIAREELYDRKCLH